MERYSTCAQMPYERHFSLEPAVLARIFRDLHNALVDILVHRGRRRSTSVTIKHNRYVIMLSRVFDLINAKESILDGSLTIPRTTLWKGEFCVDNPQGEFPVSPKVLKDVSALQRKVHAFPMREVFKEGH